MKDMPLTHPPLAVGALPQPDPLDEGLRLREQCREIVGQGYNFVLLPVSRPLPDSRTRLTLAEYQRLPHGPFSRQAHKALSSQQWRAVLGVVEFPAQSGDQQLLEYMVDEAAQWVRYLGLHGLLLPAPDAGNLASVLQYGAHIARMLGRARNENFNLWIRVAPDQAGWQAWQTLCTAVGTVPGSRLHAVPDLGLLTSATPSWDDSFQRWFGESLRAVLLPTVLYQADARGVVQLPAAIRDLVARFLRYPALSWIVSGPALHQQGHGVYRDDLIRIQEQLPLVAEEVYMRPSVDILQRPLQPLSEHLVSNTYEDFEQDPVKYARYEQAIRRSLAERHGSASSVTLMVLGAGRGPIVAAAARAARDFSGRIKLFVIEKNPSAVVTLQHRARDEWGDLDIQVVATDMRSWATQERADIIVSELLGSWGDNELSPECLDGAQHLLKPGGISIPASYTSHVSPISTAKLHNAVASLVPPGHPDLGTRKHLETAYVVRMGAVYQLAPEQPCFTFHHPNPERSGNERVATCRFTLPASLQQCIVHGFRGTFDCVLYDDIRISIADHNRSAGMFCWSPLYIPLETPLVLPGGDPLKLVVWRKVGPDSVWYEWQVAGHSHVHNSGGRSARIGLA